MPLFSTMVRWRSIWICFIGSLEITFASDLIPFRHFVDLHSYSHFLMVWIYAYCVCLSLMSLAPHFDSSKVHGVRGKKPGAVYSILTRSQATKNYFSAVFEQYLVSSVIWLPDFIMNGLRAHMHAHCGFVAQLPVSAWTSYYQATPGFVLFWVG